MVVMTSVVYFFKERFFAALGDELMLIAILFIPVYLFNNITNSLIQGMYQITLCNRLNVLQAILYVVLLLIFVYFLHKGVTAAILVNSVSMSASVIISIYFLFKKIVIKRTILDWLLIGNLIKFGSKSHIGNILKDLSYRGDVLIISYFLPPTFVGYYVVAVTFSEILCKFPDAIGTVLLPKVAAMTTETARNFTPKVCRMIVIPTILSCGAIFFFGKPIIIAFFGIEYEPSVTILLFLLPGVFALSMWKVLANDLIGQGYPFLYSITSSVALVTMILADIILIPFLGIIGAAIGSSISYTLATVIIVLIYTRLTGNSVRNLLIPKREDIAYYYFVIKIIYVTLAEKITKIGRANGRLG